MRKFLADELGVDLAENVLLVAFVAIVSTAVYLSAGHSVGGIWTHTSSQLAVANGTAPAATGSPATGGTSGGSRGCDGDHHDCDGR